MNELMEQIKKKDARAFTHGGKFHADDVFSAALLFYINPEITILRGNRVPDDFDGIVFDIGRGAYDHHQRVCHTLRLDCCGRQSVQRSLGKSWQRSLTRLLCSRWIIMITRGRKMSLKT